jgi:hypothetical protein
VPKSRGRRKSTFTPPPPATPAASKLANRWVAPLMVAFFVIGLAWIVVYYIAGDKIGFMNTLGPWNLVIGFGLLGVGFGLATRWR